MKIKGIARLKQDQSSHGSERWLVGFTDLTTLLLAFFILLFSTTQPKNEAWIRASKSMRSSFGGAAQVTEATGQPGQEDSDKTQESVEHDPGLDLSYLESLVKKWFKSDASLSTLETSMDSESVLISLPTDTAFDPGKETLSDQGKAMIDHLAPFLVQLPNTIEIVGHADPSLVNEEGRFGSNWHLSLARARIVAQALADNGYNDHVEVRGRGSSDMDLLPKNLPDDVRNQKARRVDIRLHVMQP